MKFSLSKVNYKKSPPTLGEDTEEFLKKFGFGSRTGVDLSGQTII